MTRDEQIEELEKHIAHLEKEKSQALISFGVLEGKLATFGQWLASLREERGRQMKEAAQAQVQMNGHETISQEVE